MRDYAPASPPAPDGHGLPIPPAAGDGAGDDHSLPPPAWKIEYTSDIVVTDPAGREQLLPAVRQVWEYPADGSPARAEYYAGDDPEPVFVLTGAEHTPATVIAESLLAAFADLSVGASVDG